MRRILAILGFLMIGFGIVVMLQPSEFKVERTIAIQAPREKIFSQINTLKNWDNWSPWAKLDPNATISYSGPESGVGSEFSWKGNDQVGVGSIKVTESVAEEKLEYELNFTEPFVAKNNAMFNIKPDGEKSEVTWAMWGKNNFMGKAFSLFFNCEKIIGPQFEKGLQNLKQVSEN